MTASASCAVARVGVPDLAGLHRGVPPRVPFFLESAASGGTERHRLGRFDILFCEPGDAIELGPDALAEGRAGDFLDALDDAIADSGASVGGGDMPRLPFRGGWFVFLGYELAAQVEPTLELPLSGDLPVAFAVRVRKAVVVERESGRAWLVCEDGVDEALAHDVMGGAPGPEPTTSALVEALMEDDSQRYLDAVAAARRHIVDGDVFQANLSRAWSAQLRAGVDDAQLYANLRATNPAPFAGLARWRDNAIVSSSPERLLSLRDGRVQTRPIAGTRPRGRGAHEDRALTQELIAHPKERAEHVMLIDLERNDLGRVCVPGTVRVDELMAVESYAHVHHIVSNVTGVLRADVTPGAALRAVFPGGTITGCPKVRCMGIIAALEGEARGAYTGSMGYLNRDGSGDFNILIRTIVRHGERVSLRAGAGIVADSVPDRELAETRAKAHGLLIALNAGETNA